MSYNGFKKIFTAASAFLLLVTLYFAFISEPPTIEYMELNIIIDTPKEVYVVGEAINATVYLRNPRPITAYVRPFDTSFIGYSYEEVPPVSLGHGLGGPSIEVPGDSTYKVKSKVFYAEKPGVYVLDFNGFGETVWVVDAASSSLWSGAPEVLESLQYEHMSPSLNLVYWFAVLSKVSSMNRTGRPSYLPMILVQLDPDWINGTAYVAMTRITDEYTRPILEKFSPETQRHIRFVEAPTPLIQIRAWEKMIWAQCDELKERGVIVWTSTIHYDGRILLGIEDTGEDKIKGLCETLRDVPLGVIVVYREGPIEIW